MSDTTDSECAGHLVRSAILSPIEDVVSHLRLPNFSCQNAGMPLRDVRKSRIAKCFPTVSLCALAQPSGAQRNPRHLFYFMHWC